MDFRRTEERATLLYLADKVNTPELDAVVQEIWTNERYYVGNVHADEHEQFGPHGYKQAWDAAVKEASASGATVSREAEDDSIPF